MSQPPSPNTPRAAGPASGDALREARAFPKPPCPVCGDPNAFPLWVSKEPPLGCAHDFSWHEGGEPVVRSVTECRYQMGKAWQQAEFRKLVPDAFDSTGKMLPGQLARVLTAFGKAHPGKELRI